MVAPGGRKPCQGQALEGLCLAGPPPPPLPPVPLFPVCGGWRQRASQAQEWVRGEGPGPSPRGPSPRGPSLRLLFRNRCSRRRPAPTASTGSPAARLPLVAAGRNPEAAGEGQDLWGPNLGHRWRRGTFLEWEREVVPGCLWVGLPGSPPTFPRAPLGQAGPGCCGSGGRAWRCGLELGPCPSLPCGHGHCRF